MLAEWRQKIKVYDFKKEKKKKILKNDRWAQDTDADVLSPVITHGFVLPIDAS